CVRVVRVAFRDDQCITLDAQPRSIAGQDERTHLPQRRLGGKQFRRESFVAVTRREPGQAVTFDLLLGGSARCSGGRREGWEGLAGWGSEGREDGRCGRGGGVGVGGWGGGGRVGSRGQCWRGRRV